MKQSFKDTFRKYRVFIFGLAFWTVEILYFGNPIPLSRLESYLDVIGALICGIGIEKASKYEKE